MQQVNVVEMFAQAVMNVENRKITGLTADTVIATLGLDSIEIMELVSYLEEKLGIRIPDEDLARVRTVGDLRDAIARLAPPDMKISP